MTSPKTPSLAPSTELTPLVGLFVGGRSTRMGGRPKGLLPAPDGAGPIVLRSARLVASLGWPMVLVGEASAYLAVVPWLRAIDDAPGGVGPLGGLGALLVEAGARPAIALACDMPRVGRADLERLASFEPGAAIGAAKRDEGAPWEPLFARYDPVRVLPLVREALGRGELSLQKLLGRAGARRVPLASAATVDDWDEPGDVEPPLASASAADGGGGRGDVEPPLASASAGDDGGERGDVEPRRGG